MKDEVIAVDRFGTKWVKNSPKKTFIFSKSSSRSFIKYRINNCNFKFENKVCQQIIGILVGSDAARFMAVFFLYYYKNKWILKTKKCNLKLAR